MIDEEEDKKIKRPNWKSVVEILAVLVEHEKILCTPLGHKVLKNHQQLEKYTDFMLKLGFISQTKVKNKTGKNNIIKSKTWFSLTDQGRIVYDNFKHIL